MLRLVRGCPRLRVFTDFYGYLGEGDEDADEAREILRHRGGDAIFDGRMRLVPTPDIETPFGPKDGGRPTGSNHSTP